MPAYSNRQLNTNKTKVLEIFPGAFSEEQRLEINDMGVEVVSEATHLGLSLSADPCKAVEFASKRIGVDTDRVQRAFRLLLHP
jgi:hypothetical protein